MDQDFVSALMRFDCHLTCIGRIGEDGNRYRLRHLQHFILFCRPVADIINNNGEFTGLAAKLSSNPLSSATRVFR